MNAQKRHDTLALVATIALLLTGCSQLLSVAIIPGDRNSPHLAIADIVLAIFFGLWLLVSLVKREGLRDRVPPLPYWAVVGVAVLSLLRCADAFGFLVDRFVPGLGLAPAFDKEAIKEGVPEALQIILYFICGYAILSSGLRSPRAIRLALVVFGVLTVLATVVGVYTYLQPVKLDPGWDNRLHELRLYTGASEGMQARIDPLSVGSFLGNRHIYGGFLVIALPLLFALALWDSRAWVKVVTAVAIACAAFTCLSAWHLIILVVVLIVVAGLRSLKAFLATTAVAAAFVAVMPWALPINFAAMGPELLVQTEQREVRPSERQMWEVQREMGMNPKPLRTEDLKQRWVDWQAGIEMMADYFPFGVGTGNYQIDIGMYKEDRAKKTLQPDTMNRYIVTGASMGFLGLIALVSVLTWCATRLRRADRARAAAIHPGLWAGLVGALIGIILSNIFTDSFVRGLYVPTFFVFALCGVIAQASRFSGSGDTDVNSGHNAGD